MTPADVLEVENKHKHEHGHEHVSRRSYLHTHTGWLAPASHVMSSVGPVHLLMGLRRIAWGMDDIINVSNPASMDGCSDLSRNVFGKSPGALVRCLILQIGRWG